MKQVDYCVERIKQAYLSRTPAAWIVTQDKEVADKIAVAFAKEHFGSFRAGIGKAYDFKDLYNIENVDFGKESSPCVFFNWVGKETPGNGFTNESTLPEKIERFVNYHQELQIDEASRTALDEKPRCELWQSFVIIASPYPPDFGWLNKYIETIHVGTPGDDEIKDIISTFARAGGLTIDADFGSRLTVNFRGFSEREIKQVLRRCLAVEYFDDIKGCENKILDEIRELKKQMLEGFSGLKWIDTEGNAVPATGMGAVTKWLENRKDIFSDPEKKRAEGYDVPKGVLVTGIPGTGKSLMAKHAARILRLPLISMDMGDLQEGIVGRSEEQMAKALRMVDAMSPCVLWIDEIEKAFSGAESGHSDGGVMRRMFGKFLVWMQEKTSFCFVFATSNDISKLPPEFFRSERFDEKYYNFMPTADECADIFVANFEHSNKDKRMVFNKRLTDKAYWLDVLNTKCAGSVDVEMKQDGLWADGRTPQRKLFTGADISAIVKILKFRTLKMRDEERQKGNKFNTEKYIKDILPEVIDDFMPYGQTNLNDIAKCFLTLSKTPFRSASSVSQDETIIRFSDYDELNHKIDYDPERYKGGNNNYDRTLYRCLTGAINKLLLPYRNRERNGGAQTLPQT